MTDHVAHPPDKPLLIYDGECNFCCFWIRRWQRLTLDRVEYVPFQEPTVATRFPELPRSAFETAVQLVEPSGRVFSGAEAVFRSLAANPAKRWPLAVYRAFPGAAPIADGLYRLIARHRQAFSWLTRLFWGTDPAPPAYQGVREIFLRGLGLIYLAAFVSLWVQIQGLLGSNGVSPSVQFLKGAQGYFDQEHVSIARYYLLPTWCWLSDSDGFLQGLCGAGTAFSLLLLAGVAPALCTFVLWTLYLSLTVVGGDFLLFQWDALLLETGLLALFFAPLSLLPKRARDQPVSKLMLWLLRWLLFRLMFESGCVKLLSGDSTWRSLMALQYHYETQPLPTWIGWYLHQAPASFQKGCVTAMFAIELILPFFIFGPRRMRLIACGGFVLLQTAIALTGNYCFFNYLTVLLSLLLLDDSVLRIFRRTPQAVAVQAGESASSILAVPDSPAPTRGAMNAPGHKWPLWWLQVVTVMVLIISIGQLVMMFHARPFWLGPAQALARWAAPLRSINSYGLFAVMTTDRFEIIIEGSNDNRTWQAYQFPYKPGQLNRRPPFVAPHQPRLDWQMWFAALGSYRENPWLVNCCVRLLQGSPDVLALFAGNPFPKAPPRFIRAELYEYHFSTSAQRKRDGAWWTRELRGEYLPVISLQSKPSP